MSKYDETVSFRTSAEQADELFKLSFDSRVGISEIIRNAIEEHLIEKENKYVLYSDVSNDVINMPDNPHEKLN